jgi:hypothetical protein
MADWRDVMTARAESDSARSDVDAYGGRIEDTGVGDAALAIMLGARAICLELRALATQLDYSARDHALTVRS